MKSSLAALRAILHCWDARETVNESEPVGDRSRCDVVGLRCGHGDSIAVSPAHVQASDGTAVGALMLMQVVFGVGDLVGSVASRLLSALQMMDR